MATVIVMALVAGACGGSDDKATGTTDAVDTSTAVSTDSGGTDAPAASDTASPSTDGDTSSTDAPDTTDAPDQSAAIRLSPAATGDLDSFTWATSFEAVGLDPIHSWNYPENTILPNMCEAVVQLTPDLQLEPGLASNIDISDPLKVVLTIRDGVTFWDGTPMTADDVAFSLSRNMDASLGGYFVSFWTHVGSVDVTGPSEVTITLTEPDSLFWQTLAMAAGAVSEKAYVQAKGADYGTPDGGLMCTGPYQFTSWAAGGDMVMTAYDGYWNTKLKPHSKEVVIRAVPDDAALTSALLTGEIDGTFQTPVSAIAQLQSSGAGTFYPGESTMTHMLIPSLDGPLKDVRLRKALSMAIDRTVISDIAWEGQATPVYSIASPSTWGYGKDTFSAAYDALGIKPTADLDAAKALVAEVGDVPQMTIWAPTENASLVTSANYIADVAKDIGLDIKVETVPIQVYSNWVYDPDSRAKTDLFQTVWWTDIPDPLQALYPIIEPGNTFNYYGYDNPTALTDLKSAFGESDPDKRAALVADAQQLVFGDDMLWIPLANLATPTFLGSRITGPPVGLPAYLYIPWAAYVGAP